MADPLARTNFAKRDMTFSGGCNRKRRPSTKTVLITPGRRRRALPCRPPAGPPLVGQGGRRAQLGEALFFGDFGAAEAGAAPFGRRNGSAKVNAPCAISAPATRSFLLPAMQHGERPKKVGSGHSAKGLSRYVVVNAKVFLDSADAPQEVIDFFPRNPQGLPLRFLREPRLFPRERWRG